MELTLDKIKFKTAEEKPCQVTLAVQIPGEIIRARKEKVTGEIQRAAHLPGFRSGKAPVELIRQNYSEKIRQEVLEQLLKDSVPHILKEKSLSPVSTPLIDQLQYNGEESLSFNLIVERSPEFKVKNYKRIPVEKKIKKVSDLDVSSELENLRERNSQLVPTQSERARKENFAVIRYEASAEGKPLADIRAENQMVNLSAPQSIEGFAEGIIGMARGESRDVTVDFPGEHPRKELAGKPVTFKITLQDLKEKSIPALDDEFAKDFETASLDELKKKIRESLESAQERNARSEVEKQIFDRLIEDNPLPLPESLVALQLESLMHRAREFLARQGVKADPAEKEKDLKEKYRPQAERQVRVSYLLSGIAKQESIRAGREDLGREMEKAKKADPEQSVRVEQYFREHESVILNQMTDDKVIQYLVENAKIKEITE